MNYPKTRAAALAAGATHYFTGKPCRSGHVAPRRTKGTCVECDSAREKRRWRENRTDMRAKAARWRANNPHYARNRRRADREAAAGRVRPDHCECCGLPEQGKALAFDHCHDTGEFRGWLCSNCNVGIGKLGDNLAGVKMAVAYLKRTQRTER